MGISFGISTKIRLIFFLLIATIAVGGLVIYSALRELELSNIEQKNVVNALAAIKVLQNDFSEANLLGMDIIVDHYEDPAAKVARRSEFVSLKATIEAHGKKTTETLAMVEMTERAQEMAAALSHMLDGIQDLINAIDRGERRAEVYAEFDKKIDGSKEDGLKAIAELKTKFDADFDQIHAESEGRFHVVSAAVIISNIIGILIVIGIGLPVTNRVTRSIEKVQEQIESAASMAKISSNELSEVSKNLATYSAQSAAAIQESVSSMTEMSSMLSQTSRNASDTSALSRDVLDQTRDGMAVMAEMSASMKEISSSSTRLKEIVKVIENIAAKTNVINDVVFKTQLLAVNASIEAARAGHHGKGFAVVANEVASLAALSGKASTEIKELLAKSADQVTQIIDGTSESIRGGEETSVKSSEVFQVIARSMETISERIEQIKSASTEQEIGVSQTSDALAKMNQATTATNSMAQKNTRLGRDVMQAAEKIHLVDRAMRLLVTGRELTDPAKGKQQMSKLDQILSSKEEQPSASSATGKSGALDFRSTAPVRLTASVGNAFDDDTKAA